jgi:hypothetical protein
VCDGVEWIQLAQDTTQCRVFMNTGMKLWDSTEGGKFLDKVSDYPVFQGLLREVIGYTLSVLFF